MPTNYGNYVVRPMQSFGAAEPTKIENLALMMLYAEPKKLRNIMTRAFTATNRPTMSELIKKHAKTMEFDSEREYTWDVVGTAYKNIPLIEARNEEGAVITSADLNVGKNGAHIFLLFPEKYFYNLEILVGSLNSYYQFRIYAEPIAEGTNYLYEVELMAGSDTGISGDLLQAGEKFSYEFILVEQELSRGAGGIRESLPTSMRNEFSTLRKKKKFTGRANTQLKLEMSIPVMRRDQSTGKVISKNVDSWFLNEEWIFWQEFEEECNRVDMYARSNRNSNGTYTNYGRSGIVIKEGNGLYAQMELGNTHQYNAFNDNFSLDGLEDALYDVCEKGNVPMNQRTFVITTGNRGMIQAHKAILKQTNGWSTKLGSTLQIDATSTGLIKKTSSDVHDTALSVGAQFTELRSPNGLTLKFVYDPSYDDTIRNKIIGPDGKGVLNSYRYDIWDMGSESEPNIHLCKVKGIDSTARYIIGMNNPWGIKLPGNVINHDEDSASIDVMDVRGALILDPTRCLSYVPSGLIG